MLLPFALIPLLKFVGASDILGDFALPKWSYWFAVVFGFCLYVMNFVLLFEDTSHWTWATWVVVIIACILYMALQVKAIMEPVSPLVALTKEEMEDHEYEQVLIQDTNSMIDSELLKKSQN